MEKIKFKIFNKLFDKMYQKNKKIIDTNINFSFEDPDFSQIVLPKGHVEANNRDTTLIRLIVIGQNSNKPDRQYFGYFLKFCYCYFSFSKKTPVFTKYFRIEIPPIGLLEFISYIKRTKGSFWPSTHFKIFKKGRLVLKGLAHNNGNIFKKTIYDLYYEGKHFSSLNSNFPKVVFGEYRHEYLLLDINEYTDSKNGEAIFFIRLSHYLLCGIIQSMSGGGGN